MPTCGECDFAHTAGPDLRVRNCYGNPPQLVRGPEQEVEIPHPKNPMHQKITVKQPTILPCRPQVLATDFSCSLFVPKTAAARLADIPPLGINHGNAANSDNI